VERVLADINADKGNRAVEVLRYGVLLILVPLPALDRLRGRSRLLNAQHTR
jgi:hypothetical protein